MDSLDLNQLIVLGTLLMSVVLFVTDKLRYDAVAVLVVLVLAGTNCLTPQEAFQSFSNPAVVLVASMYVFAAAVSRGGITEILCERLLGKGATTEARLALRVTVVAGLLSSVLSNAAVVATLIPVLGVLSQRSSIQVSRLYMPMAFGSLLGGMLTVVGTSKNIAVNGVIEARGGEPFGLFEFTLFGAVLLAIGCLYFVWPGRKLLPKGRVGESLSEHYQVPRFVTEILVEPHSALINKSVDEADLFNRYDITVLGLVRSEGEGTILAPGPYNRIRGDDVLMLQGEPEAILKMRSDLALRERESVTVGDVSLTADDVEMVEAVVPMTSSLVHRTLEEMDFRSNTNLNVLAISKHGDVVPNKIKHTRLEVGDTLLIQGHVRDIHRLHMKRELIMMREHTPPGFGKKGLTTLLLLLGVLAIPALTAIHLSVAALGGALGLVLLRCVRPDDVRRAVDWSVLILIGGMLALGSAFDKHGLSALVAEGLLSASGSIESPIFLLLVLIAVTTALTQVINHVASAVIMTPVAIALADQVGLDSRPFLMAILAGAEFAFMSPVAHQANAMVTGPGDYKYRDFLRAGTPLTILLIVVSALVIPLFWPLVAS